MDCTRATILLVEDDETARTFLADNLTADGFEIIEAGSAEEAERLMATEFPDLAVVDLGLPGRDGLELIRRVREADRSTSRIDPELPLIIVSGRDDELTRLRGFDRGCDDYVGKPFSYLELHGRITAVLRRSERRPSAGRIRVGSLEIDRISRQVWVDGEPVYLARKEFGLLQALASDPTRAFTREELLRGVWGYQSLGSTRTLDQHVSRLRHKLGTGGSRLIVSVWGVGYRLADGSLAA